MVFPVKCSGCTKNTDFNGFYGCKISLKSATFFYTIIGKEILNMNKTKFQNIYKKNRKVIRKYGKRPY